MKEFHPEYMVANRSGERIGYLLRETDGTLSAKQCDVTKPLKYADWEEFTSIVKAGGVQLFEIDAQGRPVPTYSEEELAALRKMSKKVKPLDEEMWYKSECVVYDDFLRDHSCISIGLVCCRRMSIVKSAVMLQGCVYAPGRGDYIEGMLLSSSLLVKRMAKDSFICNWAKIQLETILESSKMPISVCARTMRNTDNTIYKTKMLGLSPAPANEVAYIADMLEGMSTVKVSQPNAPTAAADDEGLIVSELFAQANTAFQGITLEDVRNAARSAGLSSLPIEEARKKYLDALVILMNK